MNKPIIGFTIGDINGIGPEILLKTLSDNRILKQLTPVVYSHPNCIKHFRKVHQLSKLSFHDLATNQSIKKDQINVVPILSANPNYAPGTSTAEAGTIAMASIDACIADAKAGKINGMVTAPINKNNMPDAFGGKGHTEYIANQFDDANPLMILTSSELTVALVTNHDAVGELTSKLTKKLILERLKQLNRSLQGDFYINRPKIAVLGLNPHAGDGGLIGKEEEELIQPALQEADRQGIISQGPFSPDAFFANGNYLKFDAVLAMYHDQGLIPFKMIAFDDGVNFTAGLPIVRTSPDHGTAYDIAGQNTANYQSMLAATFTNLDLLKNRQDHQLDYANPIDRTAVRSQLKK